MVCDTKIYEEKLHETDAKSVNRVSFEKWGCKIFNFDKLLSHHSIN